MSEKCKRVRNEESFTPRIETSCDKYLPSISVDYWEDKKCYDYKYCPYCGKEIEELKK